MRRTLEVGFMMGCPYLTYLMAQGLKLSGIVAILINGIILATYANSSLTETSLETVRKSWHGMAYTFETAVFLFLGLGMFGFDHPYGSVPPMFLVCFFANLLLARAANILITTWIVNCGRSRESSIKPRFQFVMWISGLRGAMAYALALSSVTNVVL